MVVLSYHITMFGRKLQGGQKKPRQGAEQLRGSEFGAADCTVIKWLFRLISAIDALEARLWLGGTAIGTEVAGIDRATRTRPLIIIHRMNIGDFVISGILFRERAGGDGKRYIIV